MIPRLFHSVFTFIVLVVLAVPACSETPKEQLHEQEIRNLSYADSARQPHKRQRMHLVLPERTKPAALLLWIPGGAWAAGNINQELPVARMIAEHGIAVAIIDHRMSPAGDWISTRTKGGNAVHPDHIKDVAKAFAWLHSKADQYGIDRNRMFVGGFSSGAHLSALLSLDPKYLAQHDLKLTDISGAIPVAGAYELTSYYDAIENWRGEEVAIGHVLGVFGTKAALPDASPTSHVGNAVVPMLVIAEGDTLNYTERLKEAVNAAGQSDLFRFVDYPDETHRSMYLGLGDKRKSDFPARLEIVDFIHDH